MTRSVIPNAVRDLHLSLQNRPNVLAKITMLLGIVVCLSIVLRYFYLCFFTSGLVFVASISSDGNYVITTDLKGYAILWDIKNQRKQIVSRHANLYSAYFVKNSPYFMWQNLNTSVHIDNIITKKIRIFKNFPTYGELISSDLKNYFATDIHWNIFSGYGKNQKILKNGFRSNAFIGNEKLLNLVISNNNEYLLSSGSIVNADYDKFPLSKGSTAYQAGIIRQPLGNFSLLDGVTLWSTITGKALFKLPGNEQKSIATLSPDGKYIVSGDENSFGYVWQINSRKILWKLDDLIYGKCSEIGNDISIFKCDKTGLIPIPPRFIMANSTAIYALKFIDLQGDFLRFTTNVPYAILYNLRDPKPIKYLLLDTSKFPCVSQYSRNQAIDTDPNSNTLVMGKNFDHGIVVYKFDPTTKTLNLIWNGE